MSARLSAQEQTVANQLALQFEAIGLPTSVAVEHGNKLVAEVLADLRPNGIDPFKTTQGDAYLSRDEFVAPRLKAGLTNEDIRFHWNRPLLLIFCEVKMRELMNFIVVDAARQQGKDLEVAGAEYKRTFPRYGDPARWNPSEKFNHGLRLVDADIYPEFAVRVDAWQRNVGSEAVSKAIQGYGTLNAAVRSLVATGLL